MLGRRLAPLLVAMLALAGCQAPGGPTPTAPTSEASSAAAPSSPSGDSATSTASTPTSTAPTPSSTPTPTSSPTPSPTATVPTVPAAVDCAIAKCIALTYDDGPSTLTPQLLDAFVARGARATLFMIGRSAETYPETVARAHELGFEVANHTWSHPMLAQQPDAVVADELARTNATLQRLTGVKPTLMRPPYASRNARTDAIAGQQGLASIVWNNSPEDWVAAHQSADVIARLTLERASRNSILLMHDIHPWTVDAAPAIIDGLQEDGYTLVTVTELLGPTEPGGLYPHF